MADLTPQQFSAKLQKLKKALSEIRARSEVVGILQLNADMQKRIFNQGLASDGKPMGPYLSAGHKKRRSNMQRQIGYKDLELTGALRRSLVVGESKGHSALGFTVDRSRIIAIGQEQQIGRPIWRPTKTELDRMLKAMITQINKDLKRALS